MALIAAAAIPVPIVVAPALAATHAPSRSGRRAVSRRAGDASGGAPHGRRRNARDRRPARRRTRRPAAGAPVAIAASATGVTYYVSPSGSDSNSGTSPSQAWQTVARVDRADLHPGDTVLFQGGATFPDQTLMPGWGSGTSGTAGAPITFASYGQGRAVIPLGVWFRSDSYLTFANLALGPSAGDMSDGGFQGTGDGITIEGLSIQHAALGIQSEGSNWRIVDNSIYDTGDSGMLLGGSAGSPGDPPGGTGYLVSGNTITDTGMNPALTYGTHGIYLKVADATVTDNTITHFNNDGISVRYRDNTITGNHISGGEIGLAWFQYDTRAGTSDWSDNTMTDLSAAGVFVCGTREGCDQPLESFRISGNSIHAAADLLNLQPTSGSYSVSGNLLG